MRCPSCQTRLSPEAKACECGELIRFVPKATPPARLNVHPIDFQGDGSTLFGMHLLNLALTGLTIGIYHFWAKVKIRQYIYSMTSFEGDRFAYHAIGQELLLGWLKVAGIFGLVLGIGLFMEFGLKIEGGMVVGQSLASLIGFILLPAAVVGSQRFRLSRTSWRGIRFSFRARTLAFCRMWLFGMVGSWITLGLSTPYFQNDVREFMTNATYFGTKRFRYNGRAKDLYGHFTVAWLLFLPTFGIYWYKYKAQRERYYWAHTSFAGARFESTVTGTGLFKLGATNMLLWMVSFGMAKPWTQVRTMHYTLQNLKLVGPLNVDRIEQDAQQAGAGGEGLADFVESSFFDMELGL